MPLTNGLILVATGNATSNTATNAAITAHLVNFAQDTKGLVPGPTSAEVSASKVLGAGGQWVTGNSAIANFSIVDSMVSNTAAILGTKISPDFGSQNVSTTGNVSAIAVTGNGAALTALNATCLTLGTIPDGRFPATYPAGNGTNLTALNASALASGTTSVSRGGTGVSTILANGIPYGNGTGPVSVTAAATGGQVFIGNAASVPTPTTITGDISISATGVSDITALSIVNADVSNSAAIAGSKVSPAFGAQTVSTSSGFTGNGANITSLNATCLTLGTVPDAAFPSTLPAGNGANLTMLNASALASGITTVPRGGTGVSSLLANSIPYGAGAGALGNTAAPTSGQLMIGNAAGVPAFVSMSGAGSITAAGSFAIGLGAVGNSQVATGLSAAKLDGIFGAQNLSATGNITLTGNMSANYYAGNGANLTGIISAVVDPMVCDGRLSGVAAASSTTAVGLTDTAATTSVYFSPFIGDKIALFDGSSTWNVRTFTELTIALGTITSGLPYDIFVYDNAGTPTARALVAWTNGTTRATALVQQNGVWVKSGATTDRYVGTIYTISTTQTRDDPLKRFIFNAQNPRLRSLLAQEPVDSWSYGTTTWRQANANSANQVEVIKGLAGAVVDLTLKSMINGTATHCQNGIGKNATNAMVSASYIFGVGGILPNDVKYIDAPVVGYHYYAWLERAEAAVTFYGDAGIPTILQSELRGVTLQ